MLKLAKLLHHRGFHITFVNTEYNHKRFLKSLGPNSLDGLPDFQYKTIPDGLPVSSDTDEDAPQDIPLLLDCIRNDFLAPFRNLLHKLNDNTDGFGSPPVTCLVSDGFMTSTITAAEELGIPIALFFTLAAVGFMGSKQYSVLVEKGLAPLKDESCLTNGYLDMVIDWVPGMKDIRLRDLPGCFRTTDPNDIVFNFAMEAVDRVDKASAVVVHTFDVLEPDVLDALSSMPPPVYAIGPLQLLLNQLPKDPLKHMGYSLWKEETGCLEWLNDKAPNSVVYVNFGSIAVMTPQQLVEFGWGLANIGGFLTHSGWNSTIESLSSGVPMLCWPVLAEQYTNCYYTCNEWGSGLEIDSDVKRDEVEKLIRELMEGEKGKKMKIMAMEWKKLAEESTGPHGSSSKNLENLVNQGISLKDLLSCFQITDPNDLLPFLWVIRPDVVVGESAIFPPEFEFETKERGLIMSLCPQEEVSNPPSVVGFLTHSSWNSTVESMSEGRFIQSEMISSIEVGGNKPHAVCTPLPLPSHVKAMLKLAKLLHHKGFHITFINTEYNHKRFLKSLGPNSLDGLPDFRYETIPDGLPDIDTRQDLPLLLESIVKNFLAPFRNLLKTLKDNNPPVTCMVSDGFLPSTITAAHEIGVPIVIFFTFAAAGFLGSKQYPVLVEKGLAPLKDESSLTNGFLDMAIDWVPGMKGIRLRDLPTCFRTTDPNDTVFKFSLAAVEGVHDASAVVVHTFDALEPDALSALSSMPPPVYAIGPLQMIRVGRNIFMIYIVYVIWCEVLACKIFIFSCFLSKFQHNILMVAVTS
ncbi:unnamed protein product [Malus baccata var. baccata]